MNKNLLSLHRDRRIVPRWRPVRPRESLVEEHALQAGVVPALNPLPQQELDETLDRWKREKSVSVALELLNSSSELEGRPELQEARRIVLASNTSSLARAVAGAHGNDPRAQFAPRDAHVVAPIALAREALRRDPYNAIAALNLAHAYCGIGRVDKADPYVRHALAVAGTNRTILRSAARYYLHRKDFEQAHRLLARAPSLLHDPWVLSGELALAEVIGKTSQHMKRAKALAESLNLEAIHRSELNAAIGDVQLHRGDHRHARKSYMAALVRPTENVVAQAHFLSSRGDVTNLPVDSAMKGLDVAHEARGMDALFHGDWKEAKRQARIWLEYEPFSHRPVNLGFTASELGDNDMESALFFAEQGQKANPGRPMQHNNYAFALAKLGRVAEAEAAFATCRAALAKEDGDAGERYVYKATAGLIAWRTGDVDGGRKGYSEAVDYFEKNGHKARLTVALWRWAEEEVRLGNLPEAAKLLERAKTVAKPKEHSFHHVAEDRFEAMVKDAVQAALPKSPTSIIVPRSPVIGTVTMRSADAVVSAPTLPRLPQG